MWHVSAAQVAANLAAAAHTAAGTAVAAKQLTFALFCIATLF